MIKYVKSLITCTVQYVKRPTIIRFYKKLNLEKDFLRFLGEIAA